MTQRQALKLVREIDDLIRQSSGDVLVIERAIGAYFRLRLMVLRKK